MGKLLLLQGQPQVALGIYERGLKKVNVTGDRDRAVREITFKASNNYMLMQLVPSKDGQ